MQKNNSVKPFSTQLSCIDTISGECITDISKEECQQICEDSSDCHYGYHVKFPYKSYCLPINYINNMNENAWTNSQISQTSIPYFGPYSEITSFVTSKFQNYPQMIRNVYLKYDDHYLTRDLTFTKNKKDAVLLNLLPGEEIFSSIILTKTDLINGEIIFLKNNENNEILSYISKSILWNTIYQYNISSDIYETSRLFYFQIIQSYPFEPYKMIDLHKPFALRIGNIPLRDQHIFYAINKNNRLDLSPRLDIGNMAEHLNLSFTFEIVQDIQDVSDKYFIDSQKKYIQDYYYYPSSDPPKNNLPIIFLIVLLISQCFLFIFSLKKKLI